MWELTVMSVRIYFSVPPIYYNSHLCCWSCLHIVLQHYMHSTDARKNISFCGLHLCKFWL